MADEREPKRKRPGMVSMYMRSFRSRAFFRVTRTLRWIFGILLTAALVWFLISGGINQVKTGENFVEYAEGIGQRVSVEIYNLFSGDSPLVINENGVYRRGVTPPKNGESIPGADKFPVSKADGQHDASSTAGNAGEGAK
jgi:hypothetical protein